MAAPEDQPPEALVEHERWRASGGTSPASGWRGGREGVPRQVEEARAEAQRPQARGSTGGAQPPGRGTRGRGSWGRGSLRAGEYDGARGLLGAKEGQNMARTKALTKYGSSACSFFLKKNTCSS
jgi:hypothetical protein